jgi:hypothetical protein
MRDTTQLVKRAFRYRFYPTDAQVSRTFGGVRLVYNKALEARARAWVTGRRCISYGQTSAMLSEWKRDPGLVFLGEVSSVPLQQALRLADSDACGVGVRPQGVLPGGRSAVKQEPPRVTAGIPAL